MDPAFVDTALSVGVGLALAAAAGLRVFVPLLVVGAAGRLGWVPLNEGFAWLASNAGLSALGVATLVEVAAYYVPWVDNLLDAAAGPLAVITGVTATAAVVTDLPPAVRWTLAVVAGGGTAGLVQSLTTLTRLKSTAVTGGVGNPVLATVELVASVLTSLVAVVFPLLAIAMVVGLLLLLRRAGRSLFRRLRTGGTA